MDDLEKKIIDVIVRTQKTFPTESIHIDSTLEELGIDSLDGVNLLFALEEEFNIALPDEAKGMKTIRDIVFGIDFLLQEQAANKTK